MNSIHAMQPEEARKPLSGRDAVAKIREIVGESPNCFFCTELPSGESAGTRPMNVRHVDDEGNLWFLSSDDSHKNYELSIDASVKLFFQGSEHSGFLHLNGCATISNDKDNIRKLWEPLLRTWFTGGIDDPRITVIKVTPLDGYYWDTRHGNAVAAVKMIAGAVLGRTLDDSVEGRLVV
jgi:general stress protein 26